MNWSDGDVERFMRLVDRLPNGCWYWTGARSRGKGNRKWYGSFRVGGKTVRAHRFSFEALGKKRLRAGFHRDHTCCFSMCVNPEHLEAVPSTVNQARKMARRGAVVQPMGARRATSVINELGGMAA